MYNMAMDLNEIRVFVNVARLGSFTAAARKLGMPNSTVSAKVTALEKRLETTLLKRTTRKLSLTDSGHAYFERSSQALAALEAADRDASATGAEGSEPQGVLRLTAPVDMGSTCLLGLVQNFTALYPKVELQLLF